MIKILTIIGARPQIIKAAAISRAIRNKFSNKIQEIIVHTGQHYDEAMSQVFFQELHVPKANYNLQVGSGSHAVQTAAMMVRIEEVLLKESPHCVLIYGDTNSTLAAGVTAAKLHVPVIHVEGGVRSFNKKFPEEINRIICDHLSTLIFVPTRSGMDNLIKEGFNESASPPFTESNPKSYYCGDIMYDNSLYFSDLADSRTHILDKLKLGDNPFVLVTLHRPDNVDNGVILERLLDGFNQLAIEQQIPFVFPMHPRTMKVMEQKVSEDVHNRILNSPFIKIIPPASFIDMILLEKKSKLIITDSGGVQKEAYYFHKPSIIILDKTPWPELVESGTALLTSNHPDDVRQAFLALTATNNEFSFPPIFGDGHAAEFICEKIIENFS